MSHICRGVIRFSDGTIYHIQPLHTANGGEERGEGKGGIGEGEDEKEEEEKEGGGGGNAGADKYPHLVYQIDTSSMKGSCGETLMEKRYTLAYGLWTATTTAAAVAVASCNITMITRTTTTRLNRGCEYIIMKPYLTDFRCFFCFSSKQATRINMAEAEPVALTKQRERYFLCLMSYVFFPFVVVNVEFERYFICLFSLLLLLIMIMLFCCSSLFR